MKSLDVTKPQEVSYCIPLWLRDEQIKQSIARIKDRIQPSEALNDESIAIVCFGPSLNDTWEKVKDFKQIITGSGSHKFLLERGLSPEDFQHWYHVEVDPRPHKVQLIGTPHKGIEYLIASTCHSKIFDLLEGFNVKLWHVFANEAEALRTLPRGEWAITGGSNVGLRQMTMARFLGFRNLHIFGMDGSEGKTGKHAAEHPMQPKDASITHYNGVDYRTTPAMLECARQTFHELNQMPDVKATFYGNGLVQALAKDYKPEPVAKDQAIIGFNKPELISEQYAELNRQLHRENLYYGVGGGKHAPTVLKLAESLQTPENKFVSVLDYGCGKGYLAKALPFPIYEYDPAVPGKEESPKPADLVVCTDTLEHIERNCLEYVLDDLRRCTKRLGYFVIHTGPASKTYSNGENTHLLQKDLAWWKNKLSKFFLLKDSAIMEKGPLLHILVAPKEDVKNKIIGHTFNSKSEVAL